MRLWSLHPKHLDSKGLIALWREALLAQKVLQGKTKGYKNHPQLIRFKNSKNPLQYIGYYLYEVYKEAIQRGYDFNKNKILKKQKPKEAITTTSGQIKYEWQHLKKKIKKRSPVYYKMEISRTRPLTHPLFKKIFGKVEKWEITK